MFAKLTFESKATSCSIEVELFESRCPQTTRNFLFLLNSHKLSDDERIAHQAQCGGLLPAPLLNSRILRIDPHKSIEFGTSATLSVFGGFFPDEALEKSIVDERSYCAGSLLMANVGANTNASHMILLLKSAPELKGAHTCFGIVRNGLEKLMEMADRTGVNKKTLQPTTPITISHVAVERRRSELGSERKVHRQAGFVRRRDDDEGDARLEEDNSKPPVEDERVLKRRRGEAVTVGADGKFEVITTAIPVQAGQAFDLFQSQKHAFGNDLLAIRDVQKQRMHNKERKQGKSLRFKGAQKGKAKSKY